MSDDEIIDGILRREGSTFTDRSDDRGGSTKYGITQRTWDEYRNRFTDEPTSVADITEPDARLFYSSMYVRPLSWIVEFGLRELVIDCAVNHGATRAVKWLQEAAGVKADGIIGPMTRAAVNTGSPFMLHADVLRTRLCFYADIVVSDPSQLSNLRGWINRACEFI